MEFPDEIYRDVCSIKTLFSPQEGFFRDFVAILLEEVDSTWIENVFRKQTSDIDKIRICCGDVKVWTSIQKILKNVSKVYRKKSAEAADQSKHEGDFCCQIGDYKKALMAYSQSIVRAPQTEDNDGTDSDTLPLAYKGRATALYHLGHYREAVTDLNLALKEKLPAPLRYQVFRQMGDCYKLLSDVEKARISLQIALKLLDEQQQKLETATVKQGRKSHKTKGGKLTTILEKEREEIKRSIADLTTVTQVDEKNTTGPAPYVAGPLPKVSGTPNERYPSASGLFKVMQSPDAGRFAAAADRIPVGTTIVVEEPQASLLVPHMLSSHCHHCFTRLLNPVPCRICSGVAFCTLQCRDAAASSYHKYECQLLGLFLGSGMSVLSHLSLRMVTQEGLEFFRRLLSKLRATDEAEFTERESRYLKVYNLMTHSHLRTGKDHFRRALMAIFLVKCLKETDYFDRSLSVPDKFSEDEILTASVILHHLQLLQFNAHEIYETRLSSSKLTRNSKAVYIGVGIYPTAALFNHECSPSVTRYFNGKNIVVKSIRPLEKNEPLSENYGPHYSKKSLRDRTRELTSRYWFRCRCTACAEDWPLVEDLGVDGFNLRCATDNCSGSLSQVDWTEANTTCWTCLRETNVRDRLKKKADVEDLFNESLRLMDEGNHADAIELLKTYLTEMFRLCSGPCREIFLAQEAMRTCCAQTGNVWILDE